MRNGEGETLERVILRCCRYDVYLVIALFYRRAT